MGQAGVAPSILMGEVDYVGVLIRGKYLLVVRGLGEPLFRGQQ